MFVLFVCVLKNDAVVEYINGQSQSVDGICRIYWSVASDILQG